MYPVPLKVIIPSFTLISVCIEICKPSDVWENFIRVEKLKICKCWCPDVKVSHGTRSFLVGDNRMCLTAISPSIQVNDKTMVYHHCRPKNYPNLSQNFHHYQQNYLGHRHTHWPKQSFRLSYELNRNAHYPKTHHQTTILPHLRFRVLSRFNQ